MENWKHVEIYNFNTHLFVVNKFAVQTSMTVE